MFDPALGHAIKPHLEWQQLPLQSLECLVCIQLPAAVSQSEIAPATAVSLLCTGLTVFEWFSISHMYVGRATKPQIPCAKESSIRCTSVIQTFQFIGSTAPDLEPGCLQTDCPLLTARNAQSLTQQLMAACHVTFCGLMPDGI